MTINEKAQAIINAAESQMGAPYVFGAWGALCTPEERQKRLNYNPDKTSIKNNCQVLSGRNPECDGCKYQGKRCFDCRGFTKWTLEQAGLSLSGQGATSQYNDGSNWLERGKVAEMPDVVCCLFQADGSTMKHTGLHVGGGRIIHCTGNPGEVKTSWLANEKAWTHYAIPDGLYSEEEINSAEKVSGLLMRGMSGDAVRNLQTLLNKCGYDCGTADGKFGSKTEAAVKAFQRAEGLPETGTADDNTLAILAARAAEDKPGIPTPVPGLGGLVSQVDAVKLRAALDDAMGRLYDAAEAQENAALMNRGAAAALAELKDVLAGVTADG